MAAARIATGWSLAILRIAALGNRLPFFAIALPYPACPVVAKAEMRHVKLRHRDADEIATLAADHLAVCHVLPQVFADPAANDLVKAALISLNFHDHGL